jgi:hypothetical protein
VVLKRVLTKVDLPKPDSPREDGVSREASEASGTMGRTNDHHSELETLSDTFAVYLVGEVGETNVAHEFLADDGGNCRRVARKRRT